MMRRSTFMLCLSLIAAAVLAVGCSDDDSTTPEKNVGDPNSPEFQSMRTAIAAAVDSTLSQLFEFASNPDRFIIGPAADTLRDIRAELGVSNPADTVLYNFVDGWHILYLGVTSLADYMATFVDSVRFKSQGEVQHHVNASTDELDLVRHVSTQYDGTQLEYQNISFYANSNYTDYNSTDQVINGTGRFIAEVHYLLQDIPLQQTYDFTVNVDNLAYDWQPGVAWQEVTATSGVIDLAGSVSSGATSTAWTITISFDETGKANVSAESQGTVYEYQMTPFAQ